MNFFKVKMFYICTNFMKNNSLHTNFIQKSIQMMLCILMFSWLGAQRHEIGIKLGGNSLVGDIGRTNYILQKPFTHSFSEHGVPVYVGAMYRLNFNPHQTLRFDLGYGSIQFDDAYAKETYRRQRGLRGINSGVEVNALFEYNFYPVNNEQKAMLSPYIFGGIGGVFYSVRRITFANDFNRDASGNAVAPTVADDFTTTPERTYANKLTLAVPFGVGLKYKFNYNWALSGELMFKPTFSDGIDYSTINNSDVRLTYNRDITNSNTNRSLLQEDPYIAVARERADTYVSENTYGNTNSKDWINSVTLSLTYSFGRPPCYCD